VGTEWIPGLELSRGFYHDVVRPLLGDVRHSAGLLGWGSDVLGYDTARSTDHGWGPRLLVFVDPGVSTDVLQDPRVFRRTASLYADARPSA